MNLICKFSWTVCSADSPHTIFNVLHLVFLGVINYHFYLLIHIRSNPLLLLLLPTQNNNTVYSWCLEKYSTQSEVSCKYSTRLRLVLYFHPSYCIFRTSLATVLSHILIVLITRSYLSVVQASSSFKWLDTCTSTSTMPIFKADMLRLVT